MPIARYLKHKKYKNIISSSIYFDEQYFLKETDIKTEDAKEYYLKNWKTINADPSPYFDREFYTETYQDVKNSSIPPLVHYILFGWKEMRAPSRYFDRAGFLREHPHIDPEKVDPAAACVMLYGGYDWRSHPAFSRPEVEGNTLSGIQLPVTAEVEPVRAAGEWETAKEYFNPEFYLSFNKDVRDAGIDPFTHFMLHGYKEDRDPSPEFDTYFYRTSHLPKDSSQNPLVHYALEGKQRDLATRRANSFTLAPSESTDDPLLSVCVHVHCFYPHLLGEMCAGLKNFPSGSHIVVTVCSAADAQFAQAFLRKTLPEQQLIDVIVVPNRGRDIAPFLVGSAHIWSKYDLVVHLHTKSSPHITWGSLWRTYLYDQIMGSPERINSIIYKFQEEKETAILYPDNFFLIKKHIPTNRNTEGVKIAASFLGLPNVDLETDEFAAGSMAWFRTASLTGLIKKIDNWSLFEEEGNQIDGTLAHALERLIAESVKQAGYTVKAYTTAQRETLPNESPIGLDTPDANITIKWPRDTPLAATNPPKPVSALAKSYNNKCLDIHWIIPSFGRGAGGHTTIFRMVRFLEEFGHNQTIWIQNAAGMDPQIARQRIIDWYAPIGKKVHVLFLPENINQLSGDVLIATDCWTAFPASQATKFKERFYFVQDLESEFHPAGSNRLIADATYDLGFAALCAGPWLEQKMRERGLWARKWDLSADQGVYFYLPKAEPGPELQIALYARPYTPRRAVEIAFAAMEVLAKRGRRFKVHLFGEENLKVDFNFPYEQHGILNHSELSQLYRRCDIGVVFSATNYSLIPLEMAACGLPVVELDCESTRAVFKNGEVTFAEATPYGVANAVEALADNPEKRNSQIQRALEFVAATSWEKSARDIEAAITERLDSLGFHSIDPTKMLAPTLKRRKKASVFIPSYNAGAEFQKVLERLASQKCDFPYDVLVIDSGSTDGTPEIVSRFADKGIRLEHIPQSEFQHGRTRNLGISMTDGDYVAILTQDAMPKDENWLANLIAGFDKGERVAGVTGRHQAYPEHGPFVANDMQNHFDALALLPNPIDMEIGLPSNYYPGSTTWRMLAYFYSDNNSAMSRSVWKEIPYPEIEWGEDYVWASLAIKAGFQKAYADDAIVFHSHDFPTKRLFKAAMEEGAFWMKEFGIELHGDLKAAIEAMNARDRAFALKHGIAPHLLRGRLKSNETLVAGRYEGMRRQKNLA
ncbi:glycosyltransferase [Rhizobium pusense]|uniref:rhamnosyltransferase WsaF family glycosyltransferase n=1 Tax=Agrobacterium pusense TaxID=648995 RepID=UPI002449FCF3|nr:rhamnan synthesis F family protein [Agrobacterium pusense]MDH0117653.1 glycosyltransferase [Agrobacterium pusense]